MTMPHVPQLLLMALFRSLSLLQYSAAVLMCKKRANLMVLAKTLVNSVARYLELLKRDYAL
jgi:hypothetical protein